MDWRTSFDCDSFLDKERNHHGYYWLDTVALTSFIENLLEQEKRRMSEEIEEMKTYTGGSSVNEKDRRVNKQEVLSILKH